MICCWKWREPKGNCPHIRELLVAELSQAHLETILQYCWCLMIFICIYSHEFSTEWMSPDVLMLGVIPKMTGDITSFVFWWFSRSLTSPSFWLGKFWARNVGDMCCRFAGKLYNLPLKASCSWFAASLAECGGVAADGACWSFFGLWILLNKSDEVRSITSALDALESSGMFSMLQVG